MGSQISQEIAVGYLLFAMLNSITSDGDTSVRGYWRYEQMSNIYVWAGLKVKNAAVKFMLAESTQSDPRMNRNINIIKRLNKISFCPDV